MAWADLLALQSIIFLVAKLRQIGVTNGLRGAAWWLVCELRSIIICHCLPTFFGGLHLAISLFHLLKLSGFQSAGIHLLLYYIRRILSFVRLCYLFIHGSHTRIVFLKADYSALKNRNLRLIATFSPFLFIKFFFQSLALLEQFLIETLLHFQVSPHILHFAIPIIQLISLIRISLLSSGQLWNHLWRLFLFNNKLLIGMLNAFLQSFLISIEGCLNRNHFLSFVLNRIFSLLHLFESIFQFLIFSYTSVFLSFLKLLLLEFKLLIVF